MTQAEKITFCRVAGNMTDQERFSDALIAAFLDIAGDVVLQRMYPFGYDDGEEVPDKYARKQCEIAVYLCNKRGAEGQTYHSGNGISRTYESASVPNSMLKGIVPMGKVLS